MIVGAAGLILLLSATIGTTQDRQSFFYSLRPGARVGEVVREIGPPDESSGTALRYRLSRGTVEVRVEKDWVASCDHLNPGDGSEKISLYWWLPHPASLPSAEASRREALVVAGSFLDLRLWGEDYIATQRHQAARCYLLQDGYVAVEDAAPVRVLDGVASTAAARATLYREGREPEVVWRLFDHWDAVRPAGLTSAEMSRRLRVLCELGSKLEADRRALGSPDGRWGSGVIRERFYLRDGLLDVCAPELDPLLHARCARFWRPGYDDPAPVAQWLPRLCPE